MLCPLLNISLNTYCLTCLPETLLNHLTKHEVPFLERERNSYIRQQISQDALSFAKHLIKYLLSHLPTRNITKSSHKTWGALPWKREEFLHEGNRFLKMLWHSLKHLIKYLLSHLPTRNIAKSSHKTWGALPWKRAEFLCEGNRFLKMLHPLLNVTLKNSQEKWHVESCVLRTGGRLSLLLTCKKRQIKRWCRRGERTGRGSFKAGKYS